MAVYFNGSRVAPLIPPIDPSQPRVVTGTITSNEEGVLTFPEFDFTPKMFTVWNVKDRDLKEEHEWEGNEEEWDESWVRYTQEGILLTAVYTDGKWVSQSVLNDSGEYGLSNASYNATGLILEDGAYQYYLLRDFSCNEWIEEDGFFDVTNTEFNFIVYGD